jgi:ADP-ribose pyrophosphatase
MPFDLIRTETLFKGRAFKIRRDFLTTPTGAETHFDIVEHGGSVVILPVDEEGKLWFVRQYRHPAGRELLELPAGTRDGAEPFEECAAREIREETGMAADSLVRLGDFYLAPGYSTEFMTVFLATGLRPDPLDADADEFIDVVRVPVSEALEMAANGQVPDAKSLAALFLARPFLEGKGGDS